MKRQSYILNFWLWRSDLFRSPHLEDDCLFELIWIWSRCWRWTISWSNDTDKILKVNKRTAGLLFTEKFMEYLLGCRTVTQDLGSFSISSVYNIDLKNKCKHFNHVHGKQCYEERLDYIMLLSTSAKTNNIKTKRFIWRFCSRWVRCSQYSDFFPVVGTCIDGSGTLLTDANITLSCLRAFLA